MLAKKYRLQLAHHPRRSGFLRRGRYLFVNVSPSTLPYSRFAVVVSASVYPRANDRNSLKRALYRALISRVYDEPVLDCIITVQRAAKEMPIHVILDELATLIR